MTIISAVPGGSGDAYARLVEGLQREFGGCDIGDLAARIFASEQVDFHWDSRVREHYLGQYFSLELGDTDDGEELSRVAILTFVAGRWHAGVCLVDGNGFAVEMLWLRSFQQVEDAAEAFARAR